MSSFISRVLSRLFSSNSTVARQPNTVLNSKYFKPCKLFEYGKETPFSNSVPVNCFNNGTIDIAPNPLTLNGMKRINVMARAYPSKKIYIDPKYFNDPKNWHS